MIEIEIGVLRSQCLDRRIATQQKLKSEIAVWQRQRNAAKARIKWMFTTDKARAKMGRAFGTQFLILPQKSLQFRALACMEIARAITVATVTVAAAFAGMGVFSLVIGIIPEAWSSHYFLCWSVGDYGNRRSSSA